MPFAKLHYLLPLLLLEALPLHAQLAVVANDNKLYLVNGVQTVAKNPAPDSATVIDLAASPPKIIAEIPNLPCSVIGPPLSVAITPDESLAFITACMKVDPADPAKQTEDNRLSIIDLTSNPPKRLTTLDTGKGPAGLSINRQGTLALVANRGEGSISIFSIHGKTVANAGKFSIGNAASALGTVAITPDGKQALVTRDGDNAITLLTIDGEKLSLAYRDIRPGLRPYAVDITPDGALAVTANIGPGNGDVDTIAVIDLHANPPRTVDVLPVGATPEGLKISPDGKWCAVVSQDGSGRPKESPFYNDRGQLFLFKIEGIKLTRIAQAPVGHWSQGVAFSNDSHTLLVCNMVEKNLAVFQFDGTTLKDTGQPIPLPGGPAAIRTAEK